MKIQTMLSEQDRKKIEEYQEKIQERMESYFDDIDSASAFSIREMTEAIRRMNNDPIIKLYEKIIEDIYTYSIPRMIIISESKEDAKILERLIGKDD